MTRVLPGVYGSIFDYSQLPEGQSSLTVGYTLACNKGTVGEPFLVTSPADFLEKTTFSGKPPIKGDPTFLTILNVLGQTNQVWISRVTSAKNPPLYGGLVLKKDTLLGDVARVLNTTSYNRVTGEPEVTSGQITVHGDITDNVAVGDIVRLYGTDESDGKFSVTGIALDANDNTVVTVGQEIAFDVLDTTGYIVELYKTRLAQPITNEEIGTVVETHATAKVIDVEGADKTDFALVGDQVVLKQVKADGTEANHGTFTIIAKEVDEAENILKLQVEETNKDKALEGMTGDGTLKLFRGSLADPENYAFKEDDLCLFYGKDQGAYNGKIGIGVVSYADTPEKLTESDVMEVTAYNTDNLEPLGQTFMCSRNLEARSIAGEPLYIEQVINGNSEYIRVKNNEAVDEDLLPANTARAVYEGTGANKKLAGFEDGIVAFGGGTDGKTITKGDTEAFISALEPFKNKAIPISLMGNGWCEDEAYQSALIDIVEKRLDCFQFLNSALADEKAQNPSTRAQNIVKHKKDLGSTSFLATMYAPHVKITDIINQTKREVGAEAIAIPGWLNVINTKGYPFAFAGYDDGLVTGCTCDWKIGDTSGEATLMNDASINYIAYDARDGVYYMQCQNTLQIANSALRNVGTVLNILDIKEHFMQYFKQFLQKPITTFLRKRILDGGKAYMRSDVEGAGRCTAYSLLDVASENDIANNTLRYLLVIAPTPYAQRIYLVMNIVNQTFDFSIYQSMG